MEPEFVDCSGGRFQVKTEQERGHEVEDTQRKEDDETLPLINEEIVHVKLETEVDDEELTFSDPEDKITADQVADRAESSVLQEGHWSWADTEADSGLKNASSFKQPQREQVKYGKFKCSLCEKSFDRKMYLTRHEKTHKREKSFQCSHCAKVFSIKSYLVIHLETHANDRRKTFDCVECGSKYFMKSSLVDHQKTHLGVRPFECPDCGRRFFRKSSLNKHQRRKEKLFACSVCGLKCSDNSSLSEHIRVHTGEKPFKCSQCGDEFSRKSNLINHLRIHSGERPYECPDCLKRFSQRSTFARHKYKVHGTNSSKAARPLDWTLKK